MVLRGAMCLWIQICRDRENLRPRTEGIIAYLLRSWGSPPPPLQETTVTEVTQGTKEMGLTMQAPCGKRRGQMLAFTLQAWWTLVSIGQLWR